MPAASLAVRGHRAAETTNLLLAQRVPPASMKERGTHRQRKTEDRKNPTAIDLSKLDATDWQVFCEPVG
jgi:hypothetical protein